MALRSIVALAFVALNGIPLGATRALAAQTAHLAHAAGPIAPASVDAHGQAFFERLKRLEGRWTAQTKDGEMVNIFRPIAFGSAVQHEEWLKGEQITATIFYMVGSELRADHFCDFKNQLRYVGRLTGDSTAIKFELKEAINLEVQPRHFFSTTWRFDSATALHQEWEIEEPGRERRFVRMDFTRQK